MASFGCVVALVGFIVDAIASGVIGSLKSCAGHNLKLYGDTNVNSYSDSAYIALRCQTEHSSYDCNCATDSSNLCYNYDLEDSSNNCDFILTDWASDIAASAARPAQAAEEDQEDVSQQGAHEARSAGASQTAAEAPRDSRRLSISSVDQIDG